MSDTVSSLFASLKSEDILRYLQIFLKIDPKYMENEVIRNFATKFMDYGLDYIKDYLKVDVLVDGKVHTLYMSHKDTVKDLIETISTKTAIDLSKHTVYNKSKALRSDNVLSVNETQQYELERSVLGSWSFCC